MSDSEIRFKRLVIPQLTDKTEIVILYGKTNCKKCNYEILVDSTEEEIYCPKCREILIIDWDNAV